MIDFELYRYDPSLAASAIVLTCFCLLTIAHVVRIVVHRSWYFIPFAIGGACEAIGYAARTSSHYDTEALNPYIIQALLILISPAFYAASIYMILGRLIRAVNSEYLSLIRTKWLTKIFVAGDILSFIAQGGGGGIQAAGNGGLSQYELGGNIIVAGLFIQIFFFGFFVATTILFHWRKIRETPSQPTQISWQRHLSVLYAVSVLVLVRSIVRVTEYLQGNTGYIITHEVFIYVFDALLMICVMVILLVWYVDDLNPDSPRRKSLGEDAEPRSESFEMMRPRTKS
ncbi:RTA1-domain-containing protein [Thozetella sp. PMI_491]|nr:RTA1-domain-containing protein [Thozetella sp. PMI_491]